MPKRKKKQSAQTQTPVLMNSAPGYGAPPAGYQAAAPGSAEAAYQAGPSPNGSGYGAPPPQAPRNPFVTAIMLYNFGKPVKGRISGVRPASGSNSKFGPPKPGWFFDVRLENGQDVTMDVKQGEQRHQRLWAAYKDNPMGHEITLRLTHPGDKTKATWTIDAH